MKPVRVTLVPLVVAAAAFFVVLPRTGGDATVRMVADGSSYAYAPERLEVVADARVRFVNDTEVTHTVTSVTEAFDITLQPGESRFLDRPPAGTAEYYCRIHGSTDEMTGTIVFGDSSATSPSSGTPSNEAEPAATPGS